MALAGGQGNPASVLYAVVRSSCACSAMALARFCTPVMTQGGKPVTVLPGLMAMSALIVPPVTHVNAVPAMMPIGSAAPRNGGPPVTTTVAKPSMPPLDASTVLVNVPVSPPAVNSPLLSIAPPFATTDHVGEIVTTLPPASLPTAVNCCVALRPSVSGFGVTVMVASAP